MELFVRKKTQPKLKLVQVNAFLLRIVYIITTTKNLGYLNLIRAIENYI